MVASCNLGETQTGSDSLLGQQIPRPTLGAFALNGPGAPVSCSPISRPGTERAGALAAGACREARLFPFTVAPTERRTVSCLFHVTPAGVSQVPCCQSLTGISERQVQVPADWTLPAGRPARGLDAALSLGGHQGEEAPPGSAPEAPGARGLPPCLTRFRRAGLPAWVPPGHASEQRLAGARAAGGASPCRDVRSETWVGVPVGTCLWPTRWVSEREAHP